MTQEKLVDTLQQLGEVMSKLEIQEALQALTGEEEIEGALPTLVSADTFAHEVLGFEEQLMA